MGEEHDLVVSRAKYLLKKIKDIGGNRNAVVSDLTQEARSLGDALSRLENGAPEVKRTGYSCESEEEYRIGRTVEKHESFGMVSFGRITGQTKLFGSHLDSHESFMRMSVYRAKAEHDLTRDWYYPDSRLPIVEIALSAAQFAEALTCLNVGDGVPCTITNVEGITMQRVPAEMFTESTKIKEGFSKSLTGLVSKLEKAHAEIKELVEAKPTVSKGRAREVVDLMEMAVREIKLNTPYIVTAFQESAEKVVTGAKAEIEAFTHIALRNAGMEHLKLQAGVQPKLIGDGEDLPGESKV